MPQEAWLPRLGATDGLISRYTQTAEIRTAQAVVVVLLFSIALPHESAITHMARDSPPYVG